MLDASSWIDSHCHLCSSPLFEKLDAVLEEAKNQDVRLFLQGGYGPEDWPRQRQLQAAHFHCLPCFGLHPEWIASRTLTEMETQFTALKQIAPQGFALGEMGLDFRTIVLEKNADPNLARKNQRIAFELQLNLSKELNKVPILHLVRSLDEAIRMIKAVALDRPPMIHGFAGDLRAASKLLDLGCYFSLGGALTRFPAPQEALKFLPLERILIESDSPDQSPKGWDEKDNRPASVRLVAKCISEVKGLAEDDLKQQLWENFFRLFDREKLWNNK